MDFSEHRIVALILCYVFRKDLRQTIFILPRAILRLFLKHELLLTADPQLCELTSKMVKELVIRFFYSKVRNNAVFIKPEY